MGSSALRLLIVPSKRIFFGPTLFKSENFQSQNLASRNAEVMLFQKSHRLQLVQLRLATLYSLYTMVQLLSSDNETFTVDKQVAERSILIKNMLEGES